ncbi:hypothetical protein TGRUB_309885A [Toxoplasma gondii RUB]|uniref:Uncharacterized protein n=1 Tax=Toxoplasma gondii RUB TaxID=935652 RepID=A0A086MA17_TOXGO|nr:hypothetical protein TGRUB_309885A [Toxoplasma gondii RUB]
MECFPSVSSPAPDPLAFLQKRVKKRESGAATYFALLPPRLDADNLLPTCQRFKLPRRTRRFSGAPQQEGQATGFCSRGGATGNSQVDSSVCKSGSATDSHWACGQTNGLCLSRLQNSWSNVEGNPVYTPRLQPLPSMYPPPEDVWAKWRSERENALIQKRSACSGHTATVCQKYLVEPTRGVQTPKPQDPRGHLTFLPAKGAPPFRNFPFDESNVNNPACETHFHEHSTRAFGDTEELCRPRRGHRMAREFSRKWLENGLSVRLSSLGKQLCRRSVGCGVEAGRPVEGESSSDGNSSLLTGKCRELSESTGQDPSEMFTHTSALTSSSSGLAYAEDPPVARQSLPPPHPPQSKERAEALLALSTTNGRVFSDFPVSSPSVLAPCGAHAREKPFRDKAFWAAAGSVSCPGWNACSARVSSFLTNPRTAVSAHVERFQALAENDVSLSSDHEGENHRPPSSAARIRTATIWEAHKQRALLTRQKVEPLQFSLKKDSGEVTRVSTSCGESHQPALERFLPNGEATEPPKALKVDRRDRNVLESLASWYKMRYEKMEVHEPFYSSHRASEFATRDAEDAESEREENNFLPQTWADFVREPTPSHSPCRVTEASVGHSAFRPPASPRSSALKRTEAEARSRAFLPSSRRIRNSGEARGADKGEGDTPEGMRGESVEVGASSAFRGLSREAAHDPVAYEKQQTKVRGKREETGFPVDERQDNGGRRSRHKDNRGLSVTPPSSRSVSESRSAWRRRRRTLRHSLQQQRETCIAEDSIIIELGEKISLPELQRVMEKVQRKAGELGRRYQDATVRREQ